MDRQQIMQIASQNPQVQQAVEMAKQQVADMDLNPQMIDEIIQVLEHVMDSPQDYPAIRAAAIRDGFVDAEDLPAEFDPVTIASLLIVFYGLKDQAGQQAFARGGLARLAAQGRGGDTMLAHINPMEAEMLRRMGGSGTINPNTGLREFKGGGLTKIIKTVAPIALAIAAPGLGMAMSAALGAGIGALGGGGLKGALIGGTLGGLGAGLGGALGGTVSNATGMGLGATGSNILGSSLIGGTVGQATGQGFGKGALMGAAGGAAGSAISGMAGTGNSALNAGLRAGGTTAGNLLTVGADAKTALKGGALAGLMAGSYQGYQNANAKPSTTVTDSMGLRRASTGAPDNSGFGSNTQLDPNSVSGGGLNKYSLSGSETALNPDMTVDYSLKTQPAPSPLEAAAARNVDQLYTPPADLPTKLGLDTTNIGMNSATGYGGLALAGLGAAAMPTDMPEEAQKAVESMSSSQKEYFNRPTVVWDWGKMMQDAAAQGQDLGTFMANNWGAVSSGQYNKQVGNAQGATPGYARGGYAHGGALNALAKGGGSGRADTIHAKLSDGEYVIDAETVALLGDGSTKEGARRLDEMRKKLRMQKGKTLAKGNFSPAAKSPLAYMKGTA
jgi:hypothetical protein